MRFWVIGCAAAALSISGCSDSSGDTTGKTTSGGTATSSTQPLSKLKVEDVKVGTGPGAVAGDTLLMEYTGTLANGTVFDATSKHDDAPFGFELGAGRVIPGWDVGMVGMKVGGERKLSIPYSQAYGEKGGKDIPPKSDLFFDVKLFKIIPRAEIDDVTVESFAKHGSGPKVKAGDTVELLYTGSFANGKVFDTNRKPGGTPLVAKVGARQVIQGFDQSLLGRQKGDRYTVTIPPVWGYGPQGQPPTIPPSSWLIFDIEIQSVK